ncbi:MAG: threonine/serine exporter family protein [Treponemataceae bacterium]
MNKIENLDEITSLALQTGKIVCESSGETYRAEDTISIVGLSLGADKVEPYVTPTGVILYAEKNNEKTGDNQMCTRFVRVKNRSTNLGKITAVNSLSRKIATNRQNITYKEVETELAKIANMKNYGFFWSVFASALSGFSFTSLFGGVLTDAFISAIIGAIMYAVLHLLSHLKLSVFISSLVGGGVISFASGFAHSRGLVNNFSTLNIGTMMYLMSGTAIVIAIRDIIAGDYVSGTARSVEAFVVGLGLSVGVVAGLFVFPSAMDYDTSLPIITKPLPAFVYSAAASVAFALVFQIKNKLHIFLISIAGGTSWLINIMLSNYGVSALQTCFLGAFFAGIISEIFALVFKAPSTVFFIPALISFVPGSGLYATMYNIVLGKSSAVMDSLLSTISIAGAIALAIAFATGGARMISGFRRKLHFIKP